VLHAHNDQTGAIAIFAALVTGCPRVVIHINHMPATPLSGRPDFAVAEPALYRRFLALPQVRVAFCSSAVADAYAEWWEIERDERLHVLWNPGRVVAEPLRPKAAARAALGITGDGPVLGSIFRFQEVKQPLVWARIALELAKRRADLRFVMVGDGPLHADVRAVVDRAGASDRFSFPGQLEDVFEPLAAMDLFMLTSASEGLPLTMIEAQMAGVPVATFDVGGVREALDPDRTGALVPPNDTDAMVEAALRILSDPAWRARARDEAPRFVDERFGIEQFCRRLFALYAT
jgi:glycosyltransferase involved in cell wall biosynthesis